jgi:catechol 2,3-dioxygenase-like lactoylglutathione lyase family enzyme
MSEISGLSHLTLTVSDVEKSTAWWTELLGIQLLFDGVEDGITYTVNMHPGTGLILGFRSHEKGAGDTFDETRTGLDHFAFHVDSRAQLEKWAGRLDELGIAHSGIKDVAYGSIITFRDPDNIQAEFFAMPGS